MTKYIYTEDVLIALTYYGKYYRFTAVLNELKKEEIEQFSPDTFKAILDGLKNNIANKEEQAVCSALHVFFETTKEFLTPPLKNKASRMLDDMYPLVA